MAELIMRRLTYRDDIGNAKLCDNDQIEAIRGKFKYTSLENEIAPIINRLAAYEDTGLDPGEIMFFIGKYKMMQRVAEALRGEE